MPPDPGRKPARARLAIALALVAGLALAAVLVARYVAAPWAVRTVLGRAGLAPATFHVTSVSLSGLRIADLSVGTAPWLAASNIDVACSLTSLASSRVKSIAVRGGVWTVRVHDGEFDTGLPPSESPAVPALDLPFDRLEVTGSTLRILVDGQPHDIPADLTLETSSSGLAAGLKLAALGGRIDLDARATAGAGTLTVDARTASPITLNVESAGISGAIDTASAHVTVTIDSDGKPAPQAQVSIRAGSLQAGGIALTNLQADLAMTSTHEVALSAFAATLGDGAAITIDPFALDPAAPVIHTRVAVTNLSLAQWLPIVTRQHATGEGRVSGAADFTLDLTGPSPSLTALSGTLAADPQHGFIQVPDADTLGAMLDQQDPRFATEPTLHQVRDRIVDAFSDFAFNRLTVDLSREQDLTLARAYVSGFGRRGEDPQGVNLTLDLHVQDTLLEFASRLASISRSKSAARSALERFFDTPAPGDTHQ